MLEQMSLFCLLALPLFYFFWRSMSENDSFAGGVWAILLGTTAALIQFFVGPLVDPGGFGLSRWMSGCIDIVTVPALAPILMYLVLIGLRIISGTADFANFALLWLIPGAAIKALGWSSLNDPVHLVLVPILWISIAVGISFFINLILNSRRWVIIPASLAILIIPFSAACSYWAFFSQMTLYGFLFLFTAAIPALISVIMAAVRSGDGA